MDIKKAKEILKKYANASIKLSMENSSNGNYYIAEVGAKLATVLNMANLAMEKQIPKKPVHRPPTNKYDDEVYECPVCQNLVGMDDIRINYCDTCGQALGWDISEEENE